MPSSMRRLSRLRFLSAVAIEAPPPAVSLGSATAALGLASGMVKIGLISATSVSWTLPLKEWRHGKTKADSFAVAKSTAPALFACATPTSSATKSSVGKAEMCRDPLTVRR